MRILEWLKRRTPSDTDAVGIEIATPPDAFVAVEPKEDLLSELEEAGCLAPDINTSENIRYDLEPMFLVIDYCDAANNHSRRRITTRWVDRRGSNVFLGAICHERKAARTFRIDRIEGVIDDDGVVEDATHFFNSLLVDEIGYATPAKQKKPKNGGVRSGASTYTLMRREMKPALVVLAAAARADSLLHPEEVDRIMQYSETEANHLCESGVVADIPSIDDLDKLGRLIGRLRPTQEDLDEALRVIVTWPEDRWKRLFKSLCRVVEADGIIVEEEYNFLAEIADWMSETHAAGE